MCHNAFPAEGTPEEESLLIGRIGATTLEVMQGDISTCAVDAVVNAANTHLWMGAGVAGAIKRQGGQGIEDEAVRQGPIPVGEAVINSLRQAAALGVTTIAMPALGTGVGGFPVAEAARVMIDATCNVLHSTPQTSLTQVGFVLFTPDARQAFERALTRVSQ